jgi:hypothetical protein
LLASHAIQGTLSYPLVSVFSEWLITEKGLGKKISLGTHFLVCNPLFLRGGEVSKPFKLTNIKRLKFYTILPLFIWISGESVTQKHTQLLYLLAVAVVIILFIILLGVIMAKRKRKHGFLWLPEGFTLRRDSSNHKRREPVGQDAVGLK